MVEKYYKIGEVTKIIDLPASTLRYWESQFRQLKPVKSSGGQRFYTEKHIETLRYLKDMLYNKKYTIEGAKLCLKEMHSKKSEVASLDNDINSVNKNKYDKDELIKELQEILTLLS